MAHGTKWKNWFRQQMHHAKLCTTGFPHQHRDHVLIQLRSGDSDIPPTRRGRRYPATTKKLTNAQNTRMRPQPGL
eukprot:727423-Prymnesium_polylepis.1